MLTCLIWTCICESVWFPLDAAVSENRFDLNEETALRSESVLAAACFPRYYDPGEKRPAKERRAKNQKREKKDEAVFCVSFNGD